MAEPELSSPLGSRRPRERAVISTKRTEFCRGENPERTRGPPWQAGGKVIISQLQEDMWHKSLLLSLKGYEFHLGFGKKCVLAPNNSMLIMPL